MSLFDMDPVCPDCHGKGVVWNWKLAAEIPCRNPSYHGLPAEPEHLPDFDGRTYERPRDHIRLGKQMVRVWTVLADGQWHTLSEIATRTGDPEASVSARIRDLRKPKFGGNVVEHENLGKGRWRYRLMSKTQ